MPPPPPPPFFLVGPPVLPPPPDETPVQVQTPSGGQPAADPVPDPTAPTEPDPPAEPPVTEPTSPFEAPAPAAQPSTVPAPMVQETMGDRAPLEPRGTAEPPAAAAVLRPGTRRVFLGVGVGRSFELARGNGDGDDYYYYYYSSATDRVLPWLRLEQSAGVHLDRSSAGFAAAIVFQQTIFGGRRDFTFGPRLVGDFPVAPNLGIYLSPSGLLGYNLGSVETIDYGYYGGGPSMSKDRSHRADLQLGLAAKILFGNRFFVMARPIDLEVVTDFSSYRVRWNVMAGFGLTLGSG